MAHAAKEARFYAALEKDRVRCELCPHRCALAPGEKGECRVRLNEGGKLYSLNYGRVTSAAMDPIEKKPLYHFHPGSGILSLGTVGCNFHCLFCQNYEISQNDVPTSELTPADAAALAEERGSRGIAYTYNEPLVWYEYVEETAKLAREAGLYNVLVTNGYVNAEPLAELLPLIDAANVDIKSISDDFYRRLCGGRVAPTLETARSIKESGTHLEITNLVITGENDSDADLAGLADWVRDNLGADTPAHLSAYSPRYRMENPRTSTATLERAYEIFSERLDHVYLGNVMIASGRDSHCRGCGALLVERSGYSGRALGLEGSRCKKCGTENNFVFGEIE